MPTSAFPSTRSAGVDGRPLRSIMKKQSLSAQNATKKRVLVNDVACDLTTGDWVAPSANHVYRYSSLDREQRLAEGLILRDVRSYERLAAGIMEKL